MPTAGIASTLNDIHERLIAGSRTASKDLFVAALGPVKAYVLGRHRELSDDDAHDLATDAILTYLGGPHRFDPQRASLWTYLCMAAGSDAVDLLRKRHRQQELLKDAGHDVELCAPRANDGSEAEASADAKRIIQAHGHRLATNEPERRVLGLLLDGEKATEAFAEALGLDPAQPDTAGLVKQAKDRLLLRIRRLRDEF